MPTSFQPTRRTVTRALALGLPALSLSGLAAAPRAAAAAAAAVPGADWDYVAKPEAAGFSAAGLEAVEAKLVTMLTTSLMVVSGGRVAYTYGDIGQISYLASARKSILSMLYGNYVAKGTIDLDRTMAQLGIDEDDGLLPIEKTARLRDLLISSSGVYHPAANPGDDPNTPARGSQKPGTHFHYNNWDFNVAGAAFEKLTGKTIFNAMSDELAAPLQMQDFQPSRQRMLGYRNRSRYLAYHMFLSGRDMARLGLLMIRGGTWNGRQIVPKAWVAESTKVKVSAAATGRGGELGYAYLWWVPTRTAPQWAGSFLASGNFGQYILGLPAIDTVIVHRRAVTDEFAVARNTGKTNFEPPRVTATDFLKIADMIVAARAA